MPQFEYFGPTPGRRPRIGVDGGGNPHMELAPHEVSDPVDYVLPNGKRFVQFWKDYDNIDTPGRTFEVGERFESPENPDPERFKEVTDG